MKKILKKLFYFSLTGSIIVSPFVMQALIKNINDKNQNYEALINFSGSTEKSHKYFEKNYQNLKINKNMNSIFYESKNNINLLSTGIEEKTKIYIDFEEKTNNALFSIVNSKTNIIIQRKK